MSSSEEYLENLLQAMMNGEVAKPSESEMDSSDKPISAIKMLTGEEPEDAEIEEKSEEESVFMDEITDDIVMSNDDLDLDTLSLPEDLDINGLSLSENAENELFEEGTMDEMAFDDIALEESGMDEMLIDESSSGDVTLDGSGLDDITLEEAGLGDITLEETGLNDITLEETGLGDIALDESSLDDIALEESGMDEMLIDESSLNDVTLEETGLGDIALDESSLDDIALEESGMDEMLIDESSLNDVTLEETDLGDITLEETGLDDITLEETDLGDITLEETGLDDITLEETGLDDITLDESSLDDITLEETGLDDITLEESELEDISNNLVDDGNGIDDVFGELDELLDQAGQDEEIDDEMLALLESVSDSEGDGPDGVDDAEFDLLQDDEDENRSAELNDLLANSDETEEKTPEKKKKRKERKRGGKKAKGSEDDTGSQDESAGKDGKNGDDTGESGTETQKKPGIFARFLAYLTESEEDDEVEKETVSLGELSDENQELLAELSDEDKQNDNAKAKEKEEKKKKGKKEKKGKKDKKAASSDEEGGGETEKEKKKRLKREQKKAAKEAKKAAKEAKEAEESINEVPDKKLSKKKVTPVILFCATITVVIILLSTVLPSFLQKRDARVAYDMGNYEETFELLYGKTLDEEDEALLHKSTIIMTMERKLASYRNYQKIPDTELEALDALIQGAALHNKLLPQAEEYNVLGEIDSIYREILEILSAQYGLSETDVILIIDSEDDATYTKWLTSVAYGISFDEGIDEEEELPPESGGIEDILPEEQEIIDELSDETVAGES